jgi:glutamyl-tRNA reductase
MGLLVIGLSHKTAAIEVREGLAFSEEEQKDLLVRLFSDPISEVFALSTCNRFEAYIVTDDASSAAARVREVLVSAKRPKETVLEKHLYIYSDHEAIRHLFRVVSGLDSMVLGENQISGQVKDAYQQAVTVGTTGPTLGKLIQKALSVSKKVRTESGIGKHPVSVSYAATLLAEKIFGDLSQTGVLLLGAGEMGELAARHLCERNVSKIVIANRTPERAAILARELKAQTVAYESFLSELENVDIVIASTAAEAYVLTEADVRECMQKRKNKPMFLIDIAVPRNIDPAVNDLENVYLYDIDHLQGIVSSNVKERERESRKAQEIIEEELDSFVAYLKSRQASPTIQQLSQKFEQIRLLEMEKYFSRMKNMTPEQKEILEACTKAIVNKILHEPIIQIKQDAGQEGPKHEGSRYAEMLRKLFGLDADG